VAVTPEAAVADSAAVATVLAPAGVDSLAAGRAATAPGATLAVTEAGTAPTGAAMAPIGVVTVATEVDTALTEAAIAAGVTEVTAAGVAATAVGVMAAAGVGVTHGGALERGLPTRTTGMDIPPATATTLRTAAVTGTRQRTDRGAAKLPAGVP
jgi:hypothetical protein